MRQIENLFHPRSQGISVATYPEPRRTDMLPGVGIRLPDKRAEPLTCCGTSGDARRQISPTTMPRPGRQNHPAALRVFVAGRTTVRANKCARNGLWQRRSGKDAVPVCIGEDGISGDRPGSGCWRCAMPWIITRDGRQATCPPGRPAPTHRIKTGCGQR